MQNIHVQGGTINSQVTLYPKNKPEEREREGERERAYLNHAFWEELGREEGQKAVQQVFPAFPEHVAMEMSQGEHGLYADLHFRVSPEKEVQ